MGSNSGNYDELPVHEVKISKGFWMSRCEITQKHWLKFMEINPSTSIGDEHPVENVTWIAIQEYLKKLNKKIKDGKEFRLPTEAEWEYAGRAGRIEEYGFSEEGLRLRDYGWYVANSNLKSHPVGQKRSNPWDLCDMNGNVWEWCQDKYELHYYKESPKSDPQGPETGIKRVMRGGCYFNNRDFCRPGIRGCNHQNHAYSFLGFRLVKDL